MSPATLALAMLLAGLAADSMGPSWLRFGAAGSGLLITLTGLGLWLWARGALRRGQTSVALSKRPTELVEGGPFRLTRNPMYLGIALMLLGLAFAFGGLAALAASLAWIWLANAVYVPFEESRMAQAFGGRWRGYAHRVRRWL